MNNDTSQRSKELLIGLRKITQAIDLHSKYLFKTAGITSPQLVILQALSHFDSLSVSELSKSVSLSQGTVTEILTRLEKKDLITRRKSDQDKRRSLISITETGRQLLQDAPSPLQDDFTKSFHALEDWEQLMILSSIKRIVTMMSAEKIEASPFLVAGPIDKK
ncbi:MarR family winged helix-turn-helix transcriptional regulator [Desulfosediminicola ganghwensis]|uniref:MarR family winged helix-turn-helix transcriptional regulator n=1 Tax=Desulfosediminicola ganghwensis TaxID=2569540 RepID=UPI001E47864A|nr:MarR family transcriptional regulator [Desulfosediminicola ganghwensis]